MSEIGDKTFLIAAILSMRQSRPVVFLGAFAALAVMSVLSALMGVMFPALLPRSLTTFAAAVLFGVFGARMLLDGLKMTGDELGEEWDEAQKEVDEEEVAMDGGGSGGAAGGMEMLRMEEGAGQGANGYPNVLPYPPTPSPAVQSSPSSSTPGAKGSSAYNFKDGARNLCMLCFSPVFAQAFVLTFLGEWGDRSQIATIALAAAHVSAGPTQTNSLADPQSGPRLLKKNLDVSIGHRPRLLWHNCRPCALHQPRCPGWEMAGR